MPITGLIPYNHPSSGSSIWVSAGAAGAISLPVGAVASIASDADIPGTLQPGGWGHIFAIRNPVTGQSRILLSASGHNPLLPGGFTEKQILNSFLIDGVGNIRQGEWREDGSFDLAKGASPVLNENIFNLHLVPAGTPLGVKMEARLHAAAFNTDAQNWGFYGFVLDPDAYPTARLDSVADYAGVTATANFTKVAGQNWSVPVRQFTDEMGRMFFGSLSGSGSQNNFGHLYLQGWKHLRVDDRPTFTIAILGASLTGDRNANNWPNVAARALRAGKATDVKVMIAGQEGRGSSASPAGPGWIEQGWRQKICLVRPHAVVIDMTADANAGFGISPALSLSNLYTIIDAVRVNNPGVPIFLFKANRMRADVTQFPNIAAYYANYATAQANRSNIGIIDTYTPWGDPALNPSDYAPADGIHPLFSGNSRVTIPTFVAAIAPLIP